MLLNQTFVLLFIMLLLTRTIWWPDAMKYTTNFFFTFIAILFLNSCKKDEPIPDDGKDFVEFVLDDGTPTRLDYDAEAVIENENKVLKIYFYSKTFIDTILNNTIDSSFHLTVNAPTLITTSTYTYFNVNGLVGLLQIEQDKNTIDYVMRKYYTIDRTYSTETIQITKFDTLAGSKVEGLFEFPATRLIEYYGQSNQVGSSGHKMTGGRFRATMQ